MKITNVAVLRELPKPVDPQAPTYSQVTMDGTTKFTSLAFDFQHMDLVSCTLQMLTGITGGTGTFLLQASDDAPPGGTPVIQNWNPPEGTWFTAKDITGQPLTVSVTTTGAWNLATFGFAPRWVRFVWDPGSLAGTFQIRICLTGKGAH